MKKKPAPPAGTLPASRKRKHIAVPASALYGIRVRRLAPMERAYPSDPSSATLEAVTVSRWRASGVIQAWARKGMDGTPCGLRFTCPIASPDGYYHPVAVRPVLIGSEVSHCRVNWATECRTATIGIHKNWDMDPGIRKMLFDNRRGL